MRRRRRKRKSLEKDSSDDEEKYETKILNSKEEKKKSRKRGKFHGLPNLEFFSRCLLTEEERGRSEAESPVDIIRTN